MADAPDNPLAPHTRPPYYAGQPIEFAGYVDDFDRTICAMEFSLDDGASWTAYPTAAEQQLIQEGSPYEIRFAALEWWERVSGQAD